MPDYRFRIACEIEERPNQRMHSTRFASALASLGLARVPSLRSARVMRDVGQEIMAAQKLQQYRGRISAAEATQGISCARKNAQRLRYKGVSPCIWALFN
jgi:hypothetical protein